MAINGQYGVGVLISGQQRVSPAARRAGTAMVGMSQQIMNASQRINQGLRLASGGINVMMKGLMGLRGAFSLAKEAGFFTRELAATQAIMGATSSTMKRLEGSVMKAALQTQFTPLEAARALRSLGQAGVSAADSMHILRPALDLAAASMGTLTPRRAMGAVIAALKVFNVDARDTRKAVDAMVYATNRFNLSIQQLPLALGNTSRGAILLQQSLEDTLIAVGLIKNVMPNVSRAATLLSSAMLRVAKSPVQKKLKELGVAITDANGKFKSFVDIVYETDKALSKRYTDSAQKAAAAIAIFGNQGVVAFNILSKQIKDGVKVQSRYAVGLKGVSKEQLRNSQVTLRGAQAIQFLKMQFLAAQGQYQKLQEMGAPEGILRMASEMRKGASTIFIDTVLSTFAGRLDLMKGAWKGFLISIGKPISEELKPVIEFIYNRLADLNDLFFKMDPGVKRLIARFALFTAATVTIAGLVIAFKALAFIALPAVFAILLAISKIVLPIVAIASILYLSWKKNILGIKTILTSFFQGFAEGFGANLPEMMMYWKEIMNDTFAAVNNILRAFGVETKVVTDSKPWKQFGAVVGYVISFITNMVLALTMVFAYIGRQITWLIGKIKMVLPMLKLINPVFGMFTGQSMLYKAGMASIQKKGGVAAGGAAALSSPSPVMPKPITPPAAPTGKPMFVPPKYDTPSGSDKAQTADQPRSIVLEVDKRRLGEILLDGLNDKGLAGLIRTPVKGK